MIQGARIFNPFVESLRSRQAADLRKDLGGNVGKRLLYEALQGGSVEMIQKVRRELGEVTPPAFTELSTWLGISVCSQQLAHLRPAILCASLVITHYYCPGSRPHTGLRRAQSLVSLGSRVLLSEPKHMGGDDGQLHTYSPHSGTEHGFEVVQTTKRRKSQWLGNNVANTEVPPLQMHRYYETR